MCEEVAMKSICAICLAAILVVGACSPAEEAEPDVSAGPTTDQLATATTSMSPTSIPSSTTTTSVATTTSRIPATTSTTASPPTTTEPVAECLGEPAVPLPDETTVTSTAAGDLGGDGEVEEVQVYERGDSWGLHIGLANTWQTDRSRHRCHICAGCGRRARRGRTDARRPT
jgi:hypothetical protein